MRPALILPGHLTKAGTRKPPSQVVFFSLRKGVMAASGQALKCGPLSVEWTDGGFGYFPCNSLGAMFAAQWFAAMRRAMPGLDAHITRGELTPVFDWLCDNIWSQASRWTTDERAYRASGETLNPAHFKAHLEARYLG